MFWNLSRLSTIACALAVGTSAAQAEPPVGPAMWKMQDADSTLYLFGTTHILPPGIEWQTEAYFAAMAETETTIVEADIDSPQAQKAVAEIMRELGLNPKGVTLSSKLGEKRAEQFAELSEKFGVPMAALEGMRPWLAWITLSLIAYQQAGFEASEGVEHILLARAKEEGDEIDHFETVRDQIEIVAGLDEDEMLANFDASIDQFADFDAMTKTMVTTWKTGDIEGMSELMNSELREHSEDAFQKLLIDRNVRWVTQIKEIMAGAGDTFVAVGVGHLVGEDSVIDLLGAEGFDVERVQ